MLKKQKWLFIAILYTIFVLVVSLVKFDKPPKLSISNTDKIVHFGIYFVFTIVWFMCFIETKVPKSVTKSIVKAAGLAFVFGVLIEVLQHINPIARSGDINDVIANTLGIIVAILVLNNARIRNALKTKK